MTRAIKSAIREVRDQLFLDRADGEYLSDLSANLNFSRPLHGWSDDDLWRAVVRRAALDHRQVSNVFRDLLTLILGPNETQIANLSVAAAIDDTEITIVTPKGIPQIGTLVIDEALTDAQTIAYSYRDANSGSIELDEALAAVHAGIGYNAADRLASDRSSGATSLILINSAGFPTSSWPYTVLVGRGTVSEESVRLTGNTTSTNTLTIDAPGLVNDHLGMQPTPIVTDLVSVEGEGEVLFVGDSQQFPEEGVIRIVKDDGLGTTAEDAVYKDNDLETGMLTLNKALTNSYTVSAPGTTVTLLKDGSRVELAQVQVKGVEWDVFETEQNVLKLYIPRQHFRTRNQDAIFLHEDDPGTSPTVEVIGSHAIGDTSLTTTVGGGLDDFPSSGLVCIDPGAGNEEHILYTRQDTQAFTRLLASDTTGIPSGSTELFVEDVSVLVAWETFNGSSKTLTLARNDLANDEIVTYVSLDSVSNKITLVAPGTVNNHDVGDHVHPGVPDTMYFAHPLTKVHAAGEDIVLDKPVYGSPLSPLEDGQIFTGEYHFQGPYLSEVALPAGRSIETTLSENLAGPTPLMMTQQPGRTCLEVQDASLFDAVFDVRVGRGRGVEEDMDVADIFLRRDVQGSTVTLDSSVSIGSTLLSLSDTSLIPAGRGYRLLLDRDDTHEEVVIVKEVLSVGTPGDVRIEEPLTISHNSAETVELMADVLELNGALEYDHVGLIPFAQRKMPHPGPLNWGRAIDSVEELREYAKVVSLTNIPTAGGQVILNFGSKLLPVESRIRNDVSAGGTSLILESTDEFPVAYPYVVDVGVDTAEEEHLAVSNNVVGTDTLTVAALEFNHRGDPSTAVDSPLGEHVQYRPGAQEVVSFSGVGTSPNRLLFDPPILFKDRHLTAEPVRLGGITSDPAGLAQEFPLYLPPSWEERLRIVFDRCRAAGVQIVVIDDK